MTDEPWHCGDGCPFRGCRECAYQGGEAPRFAIWMAKVDGCPECVVNTEAPLRVRAAFTNIAGFQADYNCTDCGHNWTTAWADERGGTP